MLCVCVDMNGERLGYIWRERYVYVCVEGEIRDGERDGDDVEGKPEYWCVLVCVCVCGCICL